MKDNTKKTLLYYWRASLKHPWSLSLSLGGVIGATILEVVSPLYYKQLFDLLTLPSDKTEILSGAVWILTIIAIITLVRWFLKRVNVFAANHFEARVITELNNSCFEYLHRNSFSYFNNNFVGSLTKKVKWFVSSFESIADRVIWSFAPLVVMLIFITIVLFGVNVWLGALVIVWLVVFLAINWFFTKFKLKYDIKRAELDTKSTGILADTITNNANVKLFNGYRREVKTYARANEELRRAKVWAWDLGSAFDSVQGFLVNGLQIGILVYAVYLWYRGEFTIGDFVLIQSYFNSITDRIWDFGNNIRRVYENLSDAEEMTVVFNTPHEIVDYPKAKKLRVDEGRIIFDRVSFSYRDGVEVLENFDLHIAPHQRLAVIGPSGSGKSTIAKLILRMHDVSGGQIFIDGQDISRVTQESLWQNVSLVPQEPMLFHRSLMENIRYGRPEATDAEVVRAAKAAHCHEFIVKMPLGYETLVGERGIKLSGGERQRVAIARAILKDAPILVMDEATSSLDSESEMFIQDALSKLMKNKTVIVIAHRLSTIRKMDRIIVIENGRIIEDGSHNDLLKKSHGVYGKLWGLQAGGFIGGNDED
ncbi:MAG: ABC transporter ATP-binding protein [Candidatus Buchananbacteria bacterium]